MRIAHRGRSGFSLLEIVLAIALLAVLFAIGIPIFRNSKANREVDAGAQEVAGVFKMARSFATNSFFHPGAPVPPAFEMPSYCQVVFNGNQVEFRQSRPTNQNVPGFNGTPVLIQTKRVIVPDSVTVTHPNANFTTYFFLVNGAIQNRLGASLGGQFRFTSNITGRGSTFTLNPTTGGVTFP